MFPIKSSARNPAKLSSRKILKIFGRRGMFLNMMFWKPENLLTFPKYFEH